MSDLKKVSGDIDEFVAAVSDYGNFHDLWDEGVEIKVEGRRVEGLLFDGNTTLELILEGDSRLDDEDDDFPPIVRPS